MIQLSVAIESSSESALPPSLPSAFRSAPHPLGTRLTGVWDGGDGPAEDALTRARQELASILEGLAGDAVVHDLLLGLQEPAQAAVKRLRKPADARVAFATRSFRFRGLRFTRLFGLTQLGRADILFEVEDDVPDTELAELLGHLVRFQLDGGPSLSPGDFMPYGWWLLSLASHRLYGEEFWTAARQELGSGFLDDAFDDRMADPTPQLVIEPKGMDDTGDFEWQIGVSRALRTMAAQRRAHTRLSEALDGELPPLMPPFCQDPCVFDPHIDDQGGFFAQRLPPRTDEDSGWHFGSDDPDHQRRDENLTVLPVMHMAARVPELVQYMALPPGWVVSPDAEGWWINPPGSERAYLDAGAEPGEPWRPRGPVRVASEEP